MASEPIVYVIDDDESARHSLEFLLDVVELNTRHGWLLLGCYVLAVASVVMPVLAGPDRRR